MRVKDFNCQFILLLIFLSARTISPSTSKLFLGSTDESLNSQGDFYTGEHPNLSKTILGNSDQQIDAKINYAFQQLFYGDDNTQRVFYPVKDEMAFIEDINNDDIRKEGMSYVMMIAVQMNKKNEFDKLRKWAKTNKQFDSGQRKYYFACHCRTNGENIDSNSALDGGMVMEFMIIRMKLKTF